jgi:Ca2+-binding EF-hand superfamily protein
MRFELDTANHLSAVEHGSSIDIDSLLFMWLFSLAQPHFVDRVMKLLQEHDTNGDNVLSYDEFKGLADRIIKRHSVLKVFLGHLDETFNKYDKDHNGTLDLDEIRAFLVDAEKQCTALPAVSSNCGHHVNVYAPEGVMHT